MKEMAAVMQELQQDNPKLKEQLKTLSDKAIALHNQNQDYARKNN